MLDYYGPARFRRLRRATAADGSTRRSTPDDTNLVLALVIDEVGNEAHAEIDYHFVAPWRVTDPNGTVEAVQRDALGVIRRRTRYGTTLDRDGADVPHGFGPIARSAPPSLAAALADPLTALADQGALHAYAFGSAPGQPLTTLGIIAEQLVHRGPDPGEAPARAQVVVTFHDGFGQALQERMRVEDGDAWGERDGAWVEAPSADRWRVSGYVERDAKLRPVAAYEPFFVDGARYDAAPERRRVGVASVTTYDALDRPVREAHPNETFADTRFTPWARTRRDPNDTAEEATAYRAARAGLDATEPERLALEQALATAGTPVTVHYDALGHEVAVSEVIEGGRVLEEHADLDIRGLSERTTDRRGRTASTRAFDRLGRALFEWSMDAGETRVLHDALGREVRSWRSPVEVGGDEAEHRRAYDAAGRLRAVRLIEGATEVVVERYHYRHASSEAARRNQIGRLVSVEDGAGQLTFARYGAFGETLESARTLTQEPGLEPDWSGEVALETRAHRSVRAHDALGREVRVALPDGSVRETRHLRSGPVSQRSLTTPDGVRRPILRDARYNTRGQPERVELGNGVVIASSYDPETFRLRQRTAAAEGEAPLQDLRHTYDPVGNLVHLDDRAQRPGAERVIRGLTVGAHRTFRYDARYQLVGATGRVHRALIGGDYRGDAPPPGSFRGSKRAALNDGHEVSRYAREYAYDDAGVLEGWTHRPDWAQRGDRLSVEKWVDPDSHRSIPRYDVNGLPESDPGGHFDARGQLTWLATVRRMEWSAREKLRRVVLIERGAGELPDDERYDYAADGTRVRKVRRRRVAQETETVETVYLDGCELRRVARSSERIVRWTAHVEDGGQRIASVYHWELDRLGTETDDPAAVRTHYLLSDQVGSVSLEVGARREYLSYEEHFPFGRTAFVAGDVVREVAMRTLRFAQKNQDDATGFYCFQHRYYAPFIGNWVSPDPAGEVDGPNRYAYARNNPVNFVDPDGLQSVLAVGPPIEDEGEAIDYYNRTFARFLMRVITDLEPVEGESGQWRIPEGGHRQMSSAEWESQLGSSRVTALTRIEGGGSALPPPGATTGAPPEAPAGGGGDGGEGVGSLAPDPEALERDLAAIAALDVGVDPLAGLPGGGGEGEGDPPQIGGHGRGNGGGGGGDPSRGPGTGRAGIGTGAGRGIGEEGDAAGRGRGFGLGTHGDQAEGGVVGGSEAGRGRRPGGSPNGRDPRPGGGGRGGGHPGQRVPPPPGARVGERAIPGAEVGTTTGTGTTPHDTSGSDIGATGGSDAGSHLGSASGGANGDLLSGGEGGEHEATFEDSVNAIVGIATGDFAGNDPEDPNANENGVTGGVLGLFDFGEATPYVAAGAAIFLLLFGRLGAAKRAVRETLEQIGDAVGRWFRGARDWVGDIFGRARRWFSGTDVPDVPSRRVPNLPRDGVEPASWGGEFIDDGVLPDTGTPSHGRRLGSLRATAPNEWRSAAGLVYGPEHPNSKFRNRVEHVLNHAEDIPTRPGPHGHGVFDSGRRGALADVDEAWQRAQDSVPGLRVTPQGNRTVYDVPMERRVGFVGGKHGANTGNPDAGWIRIVIGDRGVVTAFPVRGPG
ncbi:MAG: RHS repeat-associated core domain-containing protein [Sandaracinaceae bacterium]